MMGIYSIFAFVFMIIGDRKLEKEWRKYILEAKIKYANERDGKKDFWSRY